MSMRKVICFAALAFLLSGCEPSITKDDLNHAEENGYRSGYQEGYETAIGETGYTEDDMNAAFAAGYAAGWYDCENGNEPGESMEAYTK